MSDDSHFDFYDVWKNGAIYSLAYGRNGFSTKIDIETINEVLFLTYAYRCYLIFDLTKGILIKFFIIIFLIL